MRLFTTVSLALLCVSSAAFADASSVNSYSGLRGSLAFEGTMSGHDAATPPTTVKVSTSTGGGASVYWGWYLPYGFRTDLELLYRYQPLSDATVNGTKATVGGYSQTFTPMVNAYWDIPVGDIGVRPFVGAGIGYGWNETGLNRIDTFTFQTIHNDDWKFAYNAMAGLSIPMGTGYRLTGMYRWLHQDVGVSCAGTSCSSGFNTSSIDIGLEFDL
jgi:opacity protein-like surface antigen